MPRPEPNDPRPKRPAVDAAERLRNLYRSGDESGRTKDDNGETFAGIRRKKRHEEPDE